MLGDIKTILEIIALLAAATFFLYKLIDGWGLINLSIELNAERKVNVDNDLIVINLKLSKGDRGSLELHSVELKCSTSNSDIEVIRIPLIYPLILKTESSLKNNESRVDWDNIDYNRPAIHLPPGESTQYSHIFRIPSGVSCTVEALIVGKRTVSTRKGQWRASISIA